MRYDEELRKQTAIDNALKDHELTLVQQLESGGFASVILYQKPNGDQYVLKRFKESSEVNKAEIDFYINTKDLGMTHIPKMLCQIEEYGIIISYCGQDMLQFVMDHWSHDIMLDILTQMVECIKEVHEAGYLHQDIKLDNFVVFPIKVSDLENNEENIRITTDLTQNNEPLQTDTDNQQDLQSQSFSQSHCISSNKECIRYKVIIIDFGFVMKFNNENGVHIPQKKISNFIGTTHFASLAAHQYRQQGRRNDLESFGYSILSIMVGNACWFNIKDMYRVEQLKTQFLLRKTDLKRIQLLQKYLHQCYIIDHEEMPNYDIFTKHIVAVYKIVIGDIIEQGDTNSNLLK